MRKFATKFETISKLILIVISLSLGIFLSSLGDKILIDVTKIYKPPTQYEFLDKDSTESVSIQIAAVKTQIAQLNDEIKQLIIPLQSAEQNYQSEHEAFEAWVKTRKTLGTPEQDKEVLSRTKRLDELRLVRDKWNSEINNRNSLINKLNSDLSKLETEKNNLHNTAYQKYDVEYQSYNLKVFLIRFLFAFPILAIGVYLVVKFRKSKYNAFIWGYAFFGLYVFFVGLVPYLPSYGGYVRYIVGITLTIVIGYYVIKQLTKYTERKKSELNKSKEERARSIAYDTAIKSFVARTCPSCERAFLVIQPLTDKEPNYCIHCGLKLFRKCIKCSQRNFVHFPFCSACGSEITIDKAL